MVAGLGDIVSPPVVIIAGVLRLSCRRGVCVIGHWSSAPPLNEGNCRRVRCCAAEVSFVPAGVVLFRERRVSLISLFYSTSHFPSYYQLYELETDNKLKGSTTATHLLLGLANALAVVLSGFPRLLVLPKAKRRVDEHVGYTGVDRLAVARSLVDCYAHHFLSISRHIASASRPPHIPLCIAHTRIPQYK